MNDSHDRPPERDDTASLYGITPRAVLTDTRLSPVARLLYALLDSRQTSASRVRVTQRLLADDLGVSVRTIGAALAELRAAGWLAASRTGRSSSYRVENPSRRQHTERQAKRLLSALREKPASTEKQATATTATTAEAEALRALLRDDRGELLDLSTRASRRALKAALGRGWTLELLADELNVTSLTSAAKPGAVLAVRLQQLAEQSSPQQRKSSSEKQRQDEAERQELVLSGALACQHGEPRGETACPICRRAAADTAVGIAAALSPDGSAADIAARDALADLVTAADTPADEALAELVAAFEFAPLPRSRRTGVYGNRSA